MISNPIDREEGVVEAEEKRRKKGVLGAYIT